MINYNQDGIHARLKRYSARFPRIFHHLQVVLAVLILLALVVGICLSGSFAGGAFQSLIDGSRAISVEDVTPDSYYTVLYNADMQVMDRLVKSGSNREEVSFYRLPSHLINAFICIEDERFWEHNGVDLKGIVRAAFKGLLSADFSEGASTLTQQLIKNNIFSGGAEKSLGARIERKVQEQYLAIQLEKDLSKLIILEKYLNTINLGSNCLGVQAASKRYFNKDVSELTLSECAVIAGITQNPVYLNPIHYPEKNKERQQTILHYMFNQGKISADEMEEALADPVYDRIQTTAPGNTNSIFSYFTDAVIDEVLTDLQQQLGYTQTQAYNLLYSGGLRIYTTMEPDVQSAMDEVVNDPDNYPYLYYSLSYSLKMTDSQGASFTFTDNHVTSFVREMTENDEFDGYYSSEEEIYNYITAFKAEKQRNGLSIVSESITSTLQPQLSMVIMDQRNGHVLAITGGRGKKQANLTLNRATSSTRQPGSCFKVLAVFAPALDTCHDTLASVYYDSPVSSAGQSFSNWWGDEYLGYVNIRDSIAFSMNLATMKCLLNTVSPELAYNYVENFGISTLVNSRITSSGKIYSDKVASIGLGGITDGVTNLELTAAYATIANSGVYNKPVFYTRVLDHDGKVLLENEQLNKTVLKPTTAALLTQAMTSTMKSRDELSYYTSINPNILPTGSVCAFPGMSLAGKSGSTTDNNDVWFVGYSPYYTCGVWSGYDFSRSLQYGQTYHKEIWRQVMEKIHEGKEDIGFPENSDLVKVKICSKTGLLAIDGVCDHEDSNAHVYEEYFVKGTEPTSYCNAHQAISWCEEGQGLATEYCPKECIVKKVYFTLDDTLYNRNYHTWDEEFVMPEELVDHYCTVHKPEETTEEATEKETKEEDSSKEVQEESKDN